MVSLAPLLFLGDSHSRYFRHAAKSNRFPNREVHACEVHAATAAGLVNMDSFTRAAQTFKDFLSDKPVNSTPVFHLGEVDCGILIWLRSAKNSTSVESEMERSIEAYFHFLDELTNIGFDDIVVTGATLPTLNDTDHLGAVASERRKKVDATQRARTDLTLRFNERLEQEANLRGFQFVDVKDIVLDPVTDLVHTSFRNKNPADHHMDTRKAADVWAKRINETLAD